MIHIRLIIPPLAALFLSAGTLIAQETNPVKLVKGVIRNSKTGSPVDGGRIFAFSGGSKEPAAWSKINPKTGEYQFVLGPSTEYNLSIKSSRYLNGDVKVKTPSGSNYEEVVQNLTIEPI